MNEASVTAALTAKTRTSLLGSVVLKHNEAIQSGVPDFSVTWHGVTSWYEVKYAHPTFKSKGIQHITACRLNREGFCRYVIYSDIKGVRQTRILEPDDMCRWREIPAYDGFAHAQVIDIIRNHHMNIGG